MGGRWLGPAMLAVCVLAWSGPVAGQGVGRGRIVNRDGAERIEGEYVVRFRPEVTLASSAAEVDASGLQVVRYIASVRVFVCRAAADEGRALRALESSSVVEVMEPNFVYRAQAAVVPNDPKFGSQWGLRNTGQGGGRPGADIRGPEAWGIRSDASAAVIAVIDTGISLTHPELKENLWTNPGEVPGNGQDDDGNGYADDVHGWSFAGSGSPEDDHRHGTHVSGIMGARGMNGAGISGVAFRASLMGCKFLDRFGVGTLDGALEATAYAINNGARVLNNSWGGGGESQLLKELIEQASQKGIVYVAAAGNDGADNDAIPFYPASYDAPNVIAVAALDRSEKLAKYSNRGKTSVDLGAPGDEILSTLPGRLDYYGTLSGTSMAAPHVSAVVALLLAESPAMTPVEVKERLKATVDPAPSLAGKCAWEGRLNAHNALANTPGQPLPPWQGGGCGAVAVLPGGPPSPLGPWAPALASLLAWRLASSILRRRAWASSGP